MEREELKKKWEKIVDELSEKFADGEKLDLDGILFLIGVQELGKGFQTFKKDEKVNLLHIAVCRLLAPYGYYEFEGMDKDGWPHFAKEKDLPALKAGEQAVLMKQAVVNYFDENK